MGLELLDALKADETTRGLRLRVGVHRGAAMVATLDGRLDYFGAAARRARRLLRHARGGDLILTPEVASDPRVIALLAHSGRLADVIDAGLDGTLHRLAL